MSLFVGLLVCMIGLGGEREIKLGTGRLGVRGRVKMEKESPAGVLAVQRSTTRRM